MTSFDGRRVGERGVQRGERGRDCRDGRFGLAAPLVEEEAHGEEERRAEERERDAGLDADPAAVDRDDEEEDDADEDREAADPGQDPAAEQVLERLAGSHHLAASVGAGSEPVAGSEPRLGSGRRRRWRPHGKVRGCGRGLGGVDRARARSRARRASSGASRARRAAARVTALDPSHRSYSGPAREILKPLVWPLATFL